MPCFMLLLRWLLKSKLLPMHSVSVLIVWCWCSADLWSLNCFQCIHFLCWFFDADAFLCADEMPYLMMISYCLIDSLADPEALSEVDAMPDFYNRCTYLTLMHGMVLLHYRKPCRCINRYICWCIVWRWRTSGCHGETFTDVLADVNACLMLMRHWLLTHYVILMNMQCIMLLHRLIDNAFSWFRSSKMPSLLANTDTSNVWLSVPKVLHHYCLRQCQIQV